MTNALNHFDRICRGIPIANPDKAELLSALADEFAPYLDADDGNIDDGFSATDIAAIFTHAPHLLFLARRFGDEVCN